MLEAEFKSTDAQDRIDLTDLRTKGVQIIRNFFPDAFRQDLQRRAAEIVALRDAGKLTIHDQDSRGLPNDWFRPLVCNEMLLQLVAGVGEVAGLQHLEQGDSHREGNRDD